jgi:two-component sensor histidine kinase
MGERFPVAGRRKDGSVFPAEVSISKFITIDGSPLFTAILRDVTERKLVEQRAQLLMDELEHRTKNLFALIQAIASRSLTRPRTLDEARNVFAQRIQALSRSQSLLVGGSLEGATVADIIRLESEGFTSQIRAEGPPVILHPRVAQTFALVVHELATNAMKYGALSLAAGHVAVDWTIEGAGTDAKFKFRWQECNGPPITALPRHAGFGRAVLEGAVAQDFHVQPKISFAPEGLCYEIAAPMSAICNVRTDKEPLGSVKRNAVAPSVSPA